MSNAGWAQATATLLVGLVGFWLVHSYRRQVRLKLAERQVDSYKALWVLTSLATPERTAPLNEGERTRIYDAMIGWYFDEGEGIFASAALRDIFVAFRANLVCPPESVVPSTLASELSVLPGADAERRRGCVLIRQASLLRAQLKADLSIHIGFDYYSPLADEDRAFLRACGLSPWRRPWRPRIGRPRRRARANKCVCDLCPPETGGRP